MCVRACLNSYVMYISPSLSMTFETWGRLTTCRFSDAGLQASCKLTRMAGRMGIPLLTWAVVDFTSFF